MSLMKRYKIVKISNKLRHSFRDRSTTAAAAVTGSAASYPTTIKNFNEIPGPFRFPIIGNLYLYKLGKINQFFSSLTLWQADCLSQMCLF